jgi:RHS repeat-associated protein
MARPLRLRTSGASEELDTGVFSYDGAGNITKMGSHRYVYDLLSRIDEAQVEVPGTGCGDELLLQSGTETGTVTRESCGTVRAEGSYRVGASGDVTLRAGKRVVLGDGFSVASGGRLTIATDPTLDPEGEPQDAAQSYTYDKFGNLLSVTTEREGESDVTRTIGTSSTTNRLSVASYDLSGNVTAWAGRDYRYDPFNMLWQTKPTSGNGHTFVYGPGDERLWAIDWTAGAGCESWVETWTLRDLDGTPLRQFRSGGCNDNTADWSFERDYVYRGGGLLAAHTPEGLHHFHLDHLGSPRLITGPNGTTLAQHLYFPFGEEATSPAQDAEALKFTGHERDDLDSSGSTRDLDYMHARYFSAHLGRFQSVDPIGPAPSWPQSWNRYSYVLGNPVKYYDPEGLWPFFFPLGDLPIATIEGDPITVTTTGIPLGFVNFLGFGNFLRNLGFLNDLSSSSSRFQLYQRLHERTDFQRFFACLGQRAGWGAPGMSEVGGFALVGSTGDVQFTARMGDSKSVVLGTVPANAIAAAHVHPRSGPTGFVAGGNDVRYANVHTGFGGSRIPNYIIHAGGGVTRYLLAWIPTVAYRPNVS